MDQQDKAFITVLSAVIGTLVVITIVIFILAHLVVDDESANQDAFRTAQTASLLAIPGRVIVAGTPAAEQEQAQIADGTVIASATGLSGEQLYQQVCTSCHAQGLLNAPKLGDAEIWPARYQKGMDTLVQHVVNGFNQMPAQGQAPGASEESIKAAIAYMLTESGIELAAADQSTAAEAPAAEAPAAEAPAAEAPTAEAPAAEAPAAEAPAAEAPAAEAPTAEAPAAEAPAAEQAAQKQAAAPVAEPVAASTGTAPTTEPAAEAAVGLVLPDTLDLAQGQQTYENVCRFCHMGNIPTAPKFGDKEAWAARSAQGWDTLKEHVLNGFKGMPAKGGRPDLSDEQIINALGYLLSNSQ